MSQPMVLAMYAYVDGKWESQTEFSQRFPGYVNQFAAHHNLNLKGKVVKLVADDEVSRKYGTFTDFMPAKLGNIFETDAIFDRAGTMIRTVGATEDLAVSCGTQVFNYPISLDESKWRDYIIARDLGFSVPKTYILPGSEFVKLVGGANNDGYGRFQFDFATIINDLGGFPVYMKKATGGGRVDVYKIKDMGELMTFYFRMVGKLMMLQQNIPYTKFVRTFVFGNKTIHCSYEMDLPDGQKYNWPTHLSERDMAYLDRSTLALAHILKTPFCTMESACDENGNWYFIDITNGCNFDMRECELNVVYNHVASTLISELVDRTLNPRAMEVLGKERQTIILSRQLARAKVKEQNPQFLIDFAMHNQIDLQSDFVKRAQNQFFHDYEQAISL